MKYIAGLIVSFLLFSIGCTQRESQSNDDGMTPLMQAANDGNLALVKELVEGGADIDEKNRKGFTVIEWMKSILARTPEKLQSDAEFMKEQGMDEDAVDEIIRGSAVPGNPSEEYFDNIRLILEYLEEQSANQQSQLPAESQILEVSGSLISPNKKLKVELSNADHKLSFTHNLTQADQGIFTIDWTNHPGAFAYFDKENFAWVYDGNSRVLIAGMTNSIRLTFWDLTTWGNEIPQAIADRLPKQK